MAEKLYTQEQVYEERQRAIADIVSHIKPSEETERRLSALESAKERDEEYHRKMLEFMTRHEDLPKTLKQVATALENINNWKIELDTERRVSLNGIKILWGIFGSSIISISGFIIYAYFNLNSIIDARVSNTPVEVQLTEAEIQRIIQLLK